MRKFNWIDALFNEHPLARTPRALWRHYPHEEFDNNRFVTAALIFHRQHRFDLVKITPRSSFGIRDFGCCDEYLGDKLGRPVYLNTVVKTPQDWYRLSPLDPHQGYIRQQGSCIQHIFSSLEAEVPVIQTIFSPITQAKNLCGVGQLIDHWHHHHDALMYGLEVLAESSRRFIKAVSPWIDGICYVIQECGLHELNNPTYVEACRVLDESILRVHPGPANMLHLHGPIINFDAYCRYPVTILHWDEHAAGISLASGKDRFPGIVSGGLHWPLNGWPNLDTLDQACVDAVARVDCKRLLLSAECVIPFSTPEAELDTFCNATC